MANPTVNPDGPSMLGLYAGTQCLDKGGTICAIIVNPPTGGKKSVLQFVEDSRVAAVLELLTAPIWMTVKSIINVALSILNIASFGQLAKLEGKTDGGLDRIRVMACSALSVATLPVNLALGLVNTIREIAAPGKVTNTHLLAAHLWTGFAWARLPSRSGNGAEDLSAACQ